MNIGTAIRSIREKLDLSQKQLAARCDLSQTSLSQIENGKKRPSEKTLRRVCLAMKIPEILLYIIAMQEEDVPETKRDIYKLVYPTIVTLTLEMIDSDHRLILKS